MERVLLVNPINVVHDRNISLFRESMPQWKIRCIYNTAFPWFSRKRSSADGLNACFNRGRIGADILEKVDAVVLFTAQPRVPSCNLVQEAALRSIPVIVVEEVYQMMLEQGIVNNYFLPVDHLFAASDYERDVFMRIGVPETSIETTGCMFRYNGQQTVDPSRRAGLKTKFGLSAGKKIAVLTLRYITPNGETMEVRRDTLAMIQNGLPRGYELLVKPHPGEQGDGIRDYVAKFAPDAKVADARAPIDEVLDVADVLFDRGNSQTVIDAIQRNIPVCVIPMGKKTLFHGIADSVIVNSGADIAKALSLVDKEGIGLFTAIKKKYLSITPEEARRTTIGRITEIAEKKELFEPGRRLMELALFWAWMGYRSQALDIMDKARPFLAGYGRIAEPVDRLIRMEAHPSDIKRLKLWAGKGYRRWIVDSLWIKLMYLKGESFTAGDNERLDTYPPEMNRSQFLPFACMLYRLYKKNGLGREADSLYGRLRTESAFTGNVKKQDWRMKFDYKSKLAARNLVMSLNNVGPIS